MAFAQNQVKPNSTPNYFNSKSLFNTPENVKFFENTPKSNNNSNKNSNQNFFTHENENSQDSDDQENSILINNNQQMNINPKEHQQQQQHLYLSESKELIEINNRLGYYINAVNILNIFYNLKYPIIFFLGNFFSYAKI